MKKYVYLAGLILSVSQPDAFRVEYRIAPNGTTTGNAWFVSVNAYINEKALYWTPQNALLNSCVDNGSSCDDKNSPVKYYLAIISSWAPSNTSTSSAGVQDLFTAPCNALITYVYDSNAQLIYRTLEKVIQKTWKINGTTLTEDSTNNGRTLMDVYSNPESYWDTKPVGTCPNICGGA